MPGGRPRKTTKDLPEGWDEKVIKEYSEGASDVEVYATILGISEQTFKRLMEREEEFLRVIKRGRALSQSWWLREGRTSLSKKDFSATLWYMNMKNRFGWKDRHDHTSKDKEIKNVMVIGDKEIEF